MKIVNLRGDLTNISAKKEPLEIGHAIAEIKLFRFCQKLEAQTEKGGGKKRDFIGHIVPGMPITSTEHQPDVKTYG